MQEQRRPVEGEVSTTGWPRLCCLRLWEQELVVDYTDFRQDQRVGNQNNVTSIPVQKAKRRDSDGGPRAVIDTRRDGGIPCKQR